MIERHPRQPVEGDEHHDGGVDHQPVGERVRHLAELRLDVPAPGEVAVELVGDRREAEDDPRRPARPCSLVEQQPDEERDRGEAEQRQRVRDLAHGRRDGRVIHRLARLEGGGSVVGRDRCDPPGRLRQQPQPRVPARPARPRCRNRLLDVARRDARGGRSRHTRIRSGSTTPTSIARCAPPATPPWASSTTSAPQRRSPPPRRQPTAGIAIVLLHVAYERGGLDRMRQPSVAAYLEEVESLRAAGIAVGVAPHSVRACSRDWLEEIGAYATPRAAATPHPRRRAATRDPGVPRGARLPPDRAPGRHGLPRRADDHHPRHACERRRARSPRRHRSAHLRLPDDRVRSRRRIPPRHRGARPLDPALHRVGLEHADRPAGGAARARGDRATPDRAARDPHDGAAARDRVGRGSARPAASRSGRRSRSTRSIARSPALRPSTSRRR